MELTCVREGCGTTFERTVSEHNRSVRLGRRAFCSRACSATVANMERVVPGVPPRGRPAWRDDLSPFRGYMRSIRRRDKEANVDAEYLRELWEAQGGVCPLTGWTMVLPETSKGAGACVPETASIDRLDSSLGYRRGNVRWTSYMANLARNRFTDEQVREFAQAVASH